VVIGPHFYKEFDFMNKKQQQKIVQT